MAATSADNNFVDGNWISINKNFTELCPGPIDDMSSLIQVMVWRRKGDKPLHESMVTQFGDAYMVHPASVS